MKITKAVILDLLPVYLAGEASADTRALVDEFLAGDPELQKSIAHEWKPALLEVPRARPQDEERRTLERTRGLLRRRSWLMALACFFTGLPLSFAWDSQRGIVWTVWRSSPGAAIVCSAAALGLWIAFAVTWRAARRTRL